MFNLFPAVTGSSDLEYGYNTFLQQNFDKQIKKNEPLTCLIPSSDASDAHTHTSYH